MQTITGTQVLPSLVSISAYTTEGLALMMPFWGSIAPGTSYGISELDVYNAYKAGQKQGSPEGLPMPLEISLPSGEYSAAALPVPAEYQNGRFKPYWDTIPWNLPSFYPVNVTFILTGMM